MNTGMPGDRGNVVVGDLQGVDRFVEGLGLGQLQMGGPVLQHHLIVRQHVARLVGGVSLVHVADDAGIERGAGLGIEQHVGQHVLGLEPPERMFLLLEAQGRVLRDPAQLAQRFGHGVSSLSDASMIRRSARRDHDLAHQAS